jgi:ATP-dependent helicase/nuclease subunit B
MFSAPSQEALQDHIAAGALIITANRRLQRTLTAQIAPLPYQAAPSIFAADDWLQQQWLELQDQAFPGTDAVLLSRFQSRKLWQEIIEADPPTAGLISPDQLAQQADDAATLVEEWKISLEHPNFEHRDEYRYFRHWYGKFLALLQKRHLITLGASKRLVEQSFRSSALPRVHTILLYGFEDISPRMMGLFEAAADRVKLWRPNAVEASRCRRTHAVDSEAEIRAAALWSRERLAENPQQRVGVVVPQLNARRATVERIFSEVYEAESWLSPKYRGLLPVNFSAGVPLSSTPLIADALLLLALNSGYIQPDAWRRLLVSPFWGGDFDNCRQHLLLHLNNSTKTRLSLAEIRRAASKLQQDGDWPLVDALSSHAELLRRQPNRQSYAAWSGFFDRQLAACAWSNSRTLDSHEYQQQQHFYQILDQLAQCDTSLRSPVTLAEALHSLRELTDGAVFQAQTPDSPVQVLGLLEAIGLQFDCCWVTDLSDVSWPPAPRPNPFIPLTIQVELATPRSSVDRELRYARLLTENLRQASRDIIFSWPAVDGDVHLQPSQLVADAELAPLEDLIPSQTALQTYVDRVAQSAQFEIIDCTDAPGWPNIDLPLPGGTSVLKLQAACPFNAFAVYRLGARQREQAMPGLSGAERGTIVHELLASLWAELESHSRLESLEPDALYQLVGEKVDATLAPWRTRRSDVMHPQFYRLEQQRLINLALNILQLDKARPPFTVLATEQKQTVSLTTTKGTVHLSGRVDRIDQLPSGKHVVIDYKTGKTSLNQWQGERPADLQLALYALGNPDQVVAIAFSEVNAKRTAFAGVGQPPAEDGVIRGIVGPNKFRMSQLPGEWSETLDYWRERACMLVEEFVNGHCPAVTHIKSQAPYYRHLEPLNRMLETLEPEDE